MWSTPAAIFASSAGFRYDCEVTMGPMRIFFVSTASAASSVHASRQSVATASAPRKRWSETHSARKPAVSASRAIPTTSA